MVMHRRAGLTNDFQARMRLNPTAAASSSSVSSASASRRMQRADSINEKHHVRTSLALLEQPEHDFLSALDPAMRAGMLATMRAAILATDMSLHGQMHATFSSLVSALGTDLAAWPDSRHAAGTSSYAGAFRAGAEGMPTEAGRGCSSGMASSDGVGIAGTPAAAAAAWPAAAPLTDTMVASSPRVAALAWLLHCADVSNPLKCTALSVQWAERVLTGGYGGLAACTRIALPACL